MNVISVFHDVISTLYTVTSINYKGDFLAKVIKVFYSVNLFTNRTKASINSETILEDERRFKGQVFFEQVIQCSENFAVNRYVSKVTYIIGVLRVILDTQIADLCLKFDCLSSNYFRQD